MRLCITVLNILKISGLTLVKRYDAQSDELVEKKAQTSSLMTKHRPTLTRLDSLVDQLTSSGLNFITAKRNPRNQHQPPARKHIAINWAFTLAQSTCLE